MINLEQLNCLAGNVESVKYFILRVKIADFDFKVSECCSKNWNYSNTMH